MKSIDLQLGIRSSQHSNKLIYMKTETNTHPIFPQQPPQEPKQNYGKIAFFAFFTVIFIGGLLFIGFQLGQNKAPKQAAKPTMVVSPTPEDITKWETYDNNEYSFQYPSTWSIEGKYDDYFKGQMVTMINPSKTIKVTVSPAQIPYGFGGVGEEKSTSIKIFTDGQTFETKENIYGWGNEAADRVYVDLKIPKKKDYHILFGTGYPAADDQNPSLDDYNAEKTTIIKILSSLKITEK